MIHTLDTKAADYIPELGDGFEEGSEGSENAQGLQVADYYADADGEGIYYITYKIETAKEIEQLFVFAGRKQLLRLGKRKAGEVIEGTLYLHFGEMIPRFHSECMTITKIGFSVACEDLTKLKSVGMAAEKLSAKTKIPAIYLAGDSTVTDQTCPKPYMPGGCYSSWGQCLAYFIGESTAIDNQAHSGLTTETFRNEGHYDIVKKYIRPGDFCLFQFGHNDQKLAHLQAQTGYKENLMNYVNEIRGLCGVPILVTPLARNTWKDDGTYNDLLAEHAQAVFEVGEETGVPVIDLHKYAADLIKKNGKEASRVYFHPGDMTHTNEYGSFLFAHFIARELSKLDPLTFAIDVQDEEDFTPDEHTAILTGTSIAPGAVRAESLPCRGRQGLRHRHPGYEGRHHHRHLRRARGGQGGLPRPHPLHPGGRRGDQPPRLPGGGDHEGAGQGRPLCLQHGDRPHQQQAGRLPQGRHPLPHHHPRRRGPCGKRLHQGPQRHRRDGL